VAGTAVVAEGTETGSVASCWASSDARSGWREACGKAGAENSLYETDAVICSLSRGTRSRMG
jgi:hypothetical protein